MSRVLIITQNFYPEIGSAANRIKNIYKELTNEGYEVKVLTTDPKYPNRNIYKDSEYWNEEELENDVIRITTNVRRYSNNIFNRFFLYLEMMVKFNRAIARLDGNFDFVIATTPAIFVGLTGLNAKKKFQCPLILDVRDLWPDSLVGVGVFTFKPIISMAGLLEKKLYHGSDNIIINSEGFLPHIIDQGISNEKISFMPNSLTEDELLNKTDKVQVPNDKVTIIYTGNIGLAQDVNQLIDIAERMKHRSNVHFKIIGYGYRSKELRERLREKKILNVDFVRPKNRREATEATRTADIAYVSLVNQKVFDTVLPGKIVDYMCMGKPIVGAVSGYAADTILRAECGYISLERQTDEICEYIEKLVDDPELRNTFGENGYKFATRHYSWNKNIVVLTRLLEPKYGKESVHVRMEPLHK
ncbi:glycosyltransferase family 4 protein [Paenibacillus sp. GCM10027629]|uniref:glycosyltransferase family 4 protein n=1 Tax=Paenibacillus sp. GCM10027629 TaxID=3273414 RepID=UPI00362BCE10